MATAAEKSLPGMVGANIAAGREAKGLTQQELAVQLGTSVSRVSGWERGLHLPSQRQQPEIARVLFGGDLSALYDEAEAAA